MNTSIIVVGALCIIAAIAGGGVKLAGGEIPIISSLKRQFLLAGFGIVLIFTAAYHGGLFIEATSQKNTPTDTVNSTDPTPSPKPSINPQVNSQIESYVGTAPDSSADVRDDGPPGPKCKYHDTLSKISLGMTTNAVHSALSAGTIRAHMEETATDCDHGPAPGNWHTYVLSSSSMRAGTVIAHFGNTQGNQPPATALLTGTVVGASIVGTLTINKASQFPNLNWSMTVPVTMHLKASAKQ